MRGYRSKIHKASLNECLAAGLVLLSNWDKKSNFFDLMCGSGTIPIEAAMIAFTKVLSKELGNFNIRVNSIAPGLTKTEMMGKDVSQKIIDSAINRIPLKRAANPSEISDVAVFLASDKSRMITGAIHAVDSGYTAFKGKMDLFDQITS